MLDQDALEETKVVWGEYTIDRKRNFPGEFMTLSFLNNHDFGTSINLGDNDDPNENAAELEEVKAIDNLSEYTRRILDEEITNIVGNISNR